MLDVEYEILSEFSDGVPRGIEGLSPVERAACEHLISAGYLEKVVVTPDNNVGHFLRAWCITSNGLFALQEFEHKIQCDAEKKAQEEWDRLQAETTAIKNRRNNLHSAIIGAIVGFVLTFLLDHHAEILALIRRLVGM